jgi:hypothetical protein
MAISLARVLCSTFTGLRGSRVATYDQIGTVTISGSSTNTITLSDISQSYTDLVLVCHFLPSVNTNQPYIQFNSDTGTGTTNYSTLSSTSNGSTSVSKIHTNIYGWYPSPGPGIGTSTYFMPWVVNINNYRNTGLLKTAMSRFGNASSFSNILTHTWRSTAAISSITIVQESGTWVAGTNFTVYGLRAS